MVSATVFAQTAVPYAEKTWESGSLGGYSGLQVADIDGDGQSEILAMCSNNIINIYSAHDFALESNITVPSSGGYFTPIYDLFAVAQVDGDAALEVICKSSSILSGFKVIDGITKAVEWDRSGDMDHLAVADIDSDGMAEIIVGGNAIEVFDADTQALKGTSENITYWGNLSYVSMFRDIEVGDVIAGGNSEIVAIVDEFYGTGRIFILDSQTLEIKLNISVSGSLQCLSLADIDQDGAIEIIIGDGGVSTGTLSYFGHIFVYDSSGTLEWGSQDLGEMINAIAVSDIDSDGAMEIVTTSDRVKVLYAGNKTAVWSGTNLISVGDGDSLVLADLDGDGKKDILTRADSYSDGNRAVVYTVNGFSTAVDEGDTDDANDDGTSDDGNETENDESGSFLEDNMLIIVAVVVVVATVAAVIFMIRRKP
ncbi:MAG: VCBS repeat-containing protein [Thermoplasmata archaeon]|nr:VCBS repeat-containing protein [Thermoplasmata archaeon]